MPTPYLHDPSTQHFLNELLCKSRLPKASEHLQRMQCGREDSYNLVSRLSPTSVLGGIWFALLGAVENSRIHGLCLPTVTAIVAGVISSGTSRTLFLTLAPSPPLAPSPQLGRECSARPEGRDLRAALLKEEGVNVADSSFLNRSGNVGYPDEEKHRSFYLRPIDLLAEVF